MRIQGAPFVAIAVLLVPVADTFAQEQDHGDHAEQGAPSEAATDNTSEREHVAPDPPTLQMRQMSKSAMTRTMGMNDQSLIGSVIFDELEWRTANGENQLGWEAEAWYGSDSTKLWLKTEGERSNGTTGQAGVEILADHIFARWWSVQAGIRHDFGEGPHPDWLAFGVQGFAPYFLHVEATGYLGRSNRTTLRVKADYDLLLTQRLVLRPALEFNLYGKGDPDRGIGSGLSDAAFGLRLRYEVRREFAPYAGLEWVRQFGKTLDFSQGAGEDPSHLQWVAGVRFWF